MPTNDNRDIRVRGKRRAFEVGRFVLAIMVQAEALAEAGEASASPDASEPKNTTKKAERSTRMRTSQITDGTIFSRSDLELSASTTPSTSASPPKDEEAA